MRVFKYEQKAWVILVDTDSIRLPLAINIRYTTQLNSIMDSYSSLALSAIFRLLSKACVSSLDETLKVEMRKSSNPP